MKIPFLLSTILCFSGCTLGSSAEVKRAEQLLQLFECHNIETDQIRYNPMTNFHERILATSKDKSLEYIAQYKSGDEIFDMPLYEIIQMQYINYKSACHSLGGLTPTPQEQGQEI